MRTIFDEDTTAELLQRIGLLKESCEPQWGKMNIFQMLIHCIKWDEMVLGKKKYRQSLLGMLFGKIALKDFVSDDSPFKRNVPTVPALKVTENTGDLPMLKAAWINLVKQYAHFDNDNFRHPFFGAMTREQIGILAFKHADHHLRQFQA